MTALIDRTLRNYRILDRLGQGGMATVYLARTLKARRGLSEGAEVAVKVLHPHLAADEDIQRRFRREAGLGLVLKHPRIVTVHDVGSERVDGKVVHYIVMEVLRGRTLRQLLDARGRLPEREVIDIGRQVAEGLAEIHQRGAVHRDVKPSNIFVDEAGQVKIADLGLSRLQEPSTEISLPGTILGSVGYAAPEQMGAEPVGPAADLYAFGVTLYELASGKNPFAGVDLRSTLSAHQRLAPPRLGDVAPGISYFLEQVILALLQKEPAARLQPASRVARIFEERERSEWWWEMVRGEGTATQRLGARSQFKVHRRSRVYGRDAELDKLRDGLKTAVVGRTGTVSIVVGEAGVGKSRLVDAAIETSDPEVQRARVVVSRFLDLATPLPYFPLNEALLKGFDLKSRGRDERRARLPDVLRAHLPERSVLADAFATWITDDEPETTGWIESEAVPALYAEVFRTMSVRSPLVLVVEELQWADRGSLRVLEALIRSMAAFPIALILTTRPTGVEPDGDSAAAPFFEGVLARPATTSVHLERLDVAAVRSIVRDLGVPDDSIQPLTARLHAASEGNPAFLFAIVEDLRARGAFGDIDPRTLQDLAIPSSIMDLLTRRLDELDETERRFLEFASIIGPRFKMEPVVEGLGLDLVTASEVVGRLTRRHRLLRAFDQAYRFDHHLLRERIYREAPPERRREDHRVVARLLARAASDPAAPSRDAYEAGVHFSLGEEHVEAARYLVGAVRFLVRRSLHERAHRLATRAREHLEAIPDGALGLTARERYAVYEVLAEVSGHLNLRDRQGEALTRAGRIAHDAGDDRMIAESEVLLARHGGATARFFAALQHASNARAAAIRAEDPQLHAAALRVEAAILRTLGQTDYDDLLRESDALAAAAGDETGRAFGLLLLVQLYLATDRPEDALETAKHALSLFKRLKDLRGRGRALFHLARVYREFGDVIRATRAIDASLRIATANSDRGLEGRCLYLKGEILMRRRAYAEAEEFLTRGLEQLDAAADRTLEVYALVAIALLLSARGNPRRDPARATVHATRAVTIAQQLRLSRQEAYAYAVLAFTYLAAGRNEFALAVSRKGMRFLEQQATGRKRAAEITFIHYRCLKQLGRTEEARKQLQRARELVMERAEEIKNPVFRRAFLENDLFNVAVQRETRG